MSLLARPADKPVAELSHARTANVTVAEPLLTRPSGVPTTAPLLTRPAFFSFLLSAQEFLESVNILDDFHSKRLPGIQSSRSKKIGKCFEDLKDHRLNLKGVFDSISLAVLAHKIKKT